MSRLQDRIGYPTCARCQKPVDKVETFKDETRLVFLVTAFCHGDTEVSEVPAELFHGFDHAECGQAFAQKQLPPAEHYDALSERVQAQLLLDPRPEITW